MNKMRIAIFASGTGSNAVRLIEHFKEHKSIEVALVLSNKIDAKVLQSAKERGVEVVYKSNEFVSNGQEMTDLMHQFRIDWIVLAGYLRLIPSELVVNFDHKIINVHPSLLPKYGGKGMFGHHVHEAVIQAKEKESGITIHFVNAQFDDGAILAQFRCHVDEKDTAETLYSNKIQYLEHNYFPIVVEKTILNPNYV